MGFSIQKHLCSVSAPSGNAEIPAVATSRFHGSKIDAGSPSTVPNSDRPITTHHYEAPTRQGTVLQKVRAISLTKRTALTVVGSLGPQGRSAEGPSTTADDIHPS